MFKFFRDITSDEFGKDSDLTSVASVIGFVVGMTLYLLSQFAWTMSWVPHFGLPEYAIGFAALIGAIATCQRLKPAAVVQDVSKEP
ncbi:hypothetical protein [Glaciimonas sp. PCH181]|uniref:hypothetical protein n=1 Tax=Glaciimonas sp. PCH181 TaxID=2133943 RepID=UPI000D3BC49E|nr:hypothetical protein [Glaciimonas sp. PCH181]PUA17249.1 hypothetical protein C7W93_15060 [Glaciimonas sp. PCH181]